MKDQDEGEASEALASGTKFKGSPKNIATQINNILMQYFKKLI